MISGQYEKTLNGYDDYFASDGGNGNDFFGPGFDNFFTKVESGIEDEIVTSPNYNPNYNPYNNRARGRNWEETEDPYNNRPGGRNWETEDERHQHHQARSIKRGVLDSISKHKNWFGFFCLF